jgi:hypothetical protein
VVFVYHFVLGLALGALGTAVLIRRENLARNEGNRSRIVMGRAGWTAFGVISALAGLLQLAVAMLIAL